MGPSNSTLQPHTPNLKAPANPNNLVQLEILHLLKDLQQPQNNPSSLWGPPTTPYHHSNYNPIPPKRPHTNSNLKQSPFNPNKWGASNNSDNNTQDEPEWKAKLTKNDQKDDNQNIADTIQENATWDTDIQNEINQISNKIGHSIRWKTKLQKLATTMGISFDPKAKQEEAICQVVTAALL